jgi:PilZ domain
MPESPRPLTFGNPKRFENRVWKRFPVHRMVFCKIAEHDEEPAKSALVQDISRGGLKLVSAHHYEPGTVIKIGKTSEATSWLMARVVYASPAKGPNWAMGCVFIPKLSEDALKEWIQV